MREPIPHPALQLGSRHAGAIRSAVLDAFTQPRGLVQQRLGRFSPAVWRSELAWLDASGLALYLLDHLRSINAQHVLPPAVLVRLQANLADNTTRNAGLLAEALRLNAQLQQAGVLFANLKGISLSPDSVPDPALRCQLDLDLLVCNEHITKAQHVLESAGYALDCISGSTWEFKAGNTATPSLADLYREKPQRCVELHIAPHAGLLERVELRSFAAVDFPVLSPPDLFVSQGVHLFKHLCSPFTRAAWLLEHRRHMLARRGDHAFWSAVQQHSAETPVPLAFVALLLAKLFGDLPYEPLTHLRVDLVTPAMRLWITTYGRSAVLANFPGSKLYLLLQAAIPSSARGSAHPGGLLPSRLPRMITQRAAQATVHTELRRYHTQIRYILSRLLFHAVEAVRYALEARHFRRLVTRWTP